MKFKVLEAVNEMEETSFASISEALDFYSYDDLIKMWLEYEGIIGYENSIKNVFELFYSLIPKTIDEL